MGLAPCTSHGQGAKKGPPGKIRVLLAEDGASDTEKVNQEDRCRPNSPSIDEDQPPESERDWPRPIQSGSGNLVSCLNPHRSPQAGGLSINRIGLSSANPLTSSHPSCVSQSMRAPCDSDTFLPAFVK